MPDVADLLAVYDAQLRRWVPKIPPAGHIYQERGPLVRVIGGHRGFIDTANDVGVGGAELDALIAEQRDYFAARGEAVEWKTRRHDRPGDLADRLIAAGFVPEARETVMIGPVAQLAVEPVLPAGVALRRVDQRPDLERIAALESEVWSEDWSWLADDLAGRIAATPELIDVIVAEAGDDMVAAAWLVGKPGTDFAGLWAGSTLPTWRRRGLYRALVARRAQLARDRGLRYLQVDASDDSRPILGRLGFVAVTTTTPYVWTPPAGSG